MKILNRINIRTRLMVVYIGIIVIGFAGLTVIAGGQITSAVRTDYEERLKSEIRLVAQSISSDRSVFTASGLDATRSASLLNTFEAQVNGTLTLCAVQPHKDSHNDANGKLSSDPDDGNNPNNNPNSNQQTDQAGPKAPELETAVRGEIIFVERANDQGEPTFYTAAPVFYDDQLRATIQLAVPKENLQSIVFQRWAALALGFLLLTSLAILASLWLAQSIIRPLYALREATLKLSHGDLSHRATSIGSDEIGQVTQAFNQMADKVQAMVEEQQAFASNTSHELRTPLTALRLRTETLLYDTTLDAATTRQYIEELDSEIAYLGDLVQDLTLLSRFDAGRAERGHDEIDCNRLAMNLYQQETGRATEKQINISLSLSDTPALISGSLSHVTVVFRNILENALKYTPDGGNVIWSVCKVGNKVVNSIQDTGHGIAQEDLNHIFERFYRADKSHSRDIPGTGLGLTLVKSIVDAYGAEITIKSDGPDTGTTVTVSWPSYTGNGFQSDSTTND